MSKQNCILLKLYLVFSFICLASCAPSKIEASSFSDSTSFENFVYFDNHIRNYDYEKEDEYYNLSSKGLNFTEVDYIVGEHLLTKLCDHGVYNGYHIYSTLVSDNVTYTQNSNGSKGTLIDPVAMDHPPFIIDGYYFGGPAWEWINENNQYNSSCVIGIKEGYELKQEIIRDRINENAVMTLQDMAMNNILSSADLNKIYNEYIYMNYLKDYFITFNREPDLSFGLGYSPDRFNSFWSLALAGSNRFRYRSNDALNVIPKLEYSTTLPNEIPSKQIMSFDEHAYYPVTMEKVIFNHNLDNALYFGNYDGYEIFATLDDIDESKVAYNDYNIKINTYDSDTYKKKDWYWDYSALFRNRYYFGNFHYDIFAYDQGYCFYLPVLYDMRGYIKEETIEKIAYQVYSYQLDEAIKRNEKLDEFNSNYIKAWNDNYRGRNNIISMQIDAKNQGITGEFNKIVKIELTSDEFKKFKSYEPEDFGLSSDYYVLFDPINNISDYENDFKQDDNWEENANSSHRYVYLYTLAGNDAENTAYYLENRCNLVKNVECISHIS